MSFFGPNASDGGPADYLPPDMYPKGLRDIRITRCEFRNMFSVGVGGGMSQKVEISNCYFHGDGYWVAAIAPETGAWTDWQLDWDIHHNTFEFRDGKGPTENTIRLGTNTPEAEAHRRHTRRAICAIYSFGYGEPPEKKYPNTIKGIRFTSNVVYQGVAQFWSYAYGDVSNNEFYNYYEDITGVALLGTDPIVVYGVPKLSDTWKREDMARGWRIKNNHLESSLDGHGLNLYSAEDIDVSGNTIIGPRISGIRLDSCSGYVGPNRIINIGKKVPPEQQSTSVIGHGVIVFGNTGITPLTIDGQVVIDTRPDADKCTLHGVSCNVGYWPRTIVTGTRAHGVLGKAVNDTSNNICVDQFDNFKSDPADRTFATNRAMAAYALTLETSLEVKGHHTGKSLALSESFSARDAQFTNAIKAGSVRGSFLGIDVPTGGTPQSPTKGSFTFFVNDKVLAQLTAVDDGSILIQQFNKDTGGLIRTPLVIGGDGSFYLDNTTWERPFRIGGQFYLWNDGFQMRTKYLSRPTSSTDGTLFSSFVGVPNKPDTAGLPGYWSADENYAYHCYGVNQWIRVPKDTNAWSPPPIT